VRQPRYPVTSIRDLMYLARRPVPPVSRSSRAAGPATDDL